MARAGNNPKRRIMPSGQNTAELLTALAARAAYVGSANHKRFPGDYGFQPPSNPRAWKSLCDKERIVLLGEAQALLRSGIMRGLISNHSEGGLPKYIWAVDERNCPFEAKIGLGGYHGYRLEADDDMANVVLTAWRAR